MAWLELEIRNVPRGRIKPLSTVLFGMGASGIQEEAPPGQTATYRQPWDTGPPPTPSKTVWLRAWLEDPRIQDVEHAVSDLVTTTALHWSQLPDTDWSTAWQEHFPPILISDRLAIAPTFAPIDGAILIEPGQGFGTGQHGTTQLALHAMDEILEQPAMPVLDVGCGSGVLALAAAHLGHTAWGIDIDDAAVRDAHVNAKRNGLKARFDDTAVHAVPGRFDLVVANLYAELLVELHPELIRVTDRWLVLTGIMLSKEDAVRTVFDRVFPLRRRQTDDEWVCLTYERPE